MSLCVSDKIQEAAMRKILQAVDLDERKQRYRDHLHGRFALSGDVPDQDKRAKQEFEEEEEELWPT